MLTRHIRENKDRARKNEERKRWFVMRTLLPRKKGASPDCLNKAGGEQQWDSINDVLSCLDHIHHIHTRRSARGGGW